MHYKAWGVELTIHLLLVPRSRMHGAIPTRFHGVVLS